MGRGEIFFFPCEVCVIESEIRTVSGHCDSHDVLFDMKMCGCVGDSQPF